MVQILPLLLAVLCSPCSAYELFLDNFNDGDDLGWTTPLAGKLSQLTWGSIKSVGY